MPYALRRPRLYYERHGAGEPLLLITGFTISARVFEPILDRYGERFECITYDNRGSGRSDAPWRLTSMPELAGDAVRLLDALEVDSAHVYGLSMGGMIAQELAIRFPERVRGLVLGCSTPGGPWAIRPNLREWGVLARMAVGGLQGDGSPLLAGALFSPEFRRNHPRRTRELLHHFEVARSRPQAIAGHWWASFYHDTVARLHAIQAPTLVMHGERDAMAPLANAHLLAQRIPDAEVAVVPGAGHAYLLERPEASFALLTEWLDRRATVSAGSPNRGLSAAMEPVTRALGLPIGALRTGRSVLEKGFRLRSSQL